MEKQSMKKRTMFILSCLVSGGAIAQSKPEVVLPVKDKTTLKKVELSQDEILAELRARGIVRELPGYRSPLVNYGLLADELQRAGNKQDDVIFVLKNVQLAFDIFEEEDIKRRSLTEILDELGVLEKDERLAGPGTICM